VTEHRKDDRTRERFDLAVDRAVREMLDVEPPADLRAKVIARIDERPGSGFPLTAFGFRRFAALVAAAALLVLVVLLARRSEAPAQAPINARTEDQRLPAETHIRTATPGPAVQQPGATSAGASSVGAASAGAASAGAASAGAASAGATSAGTAAAKNTTARITEALASAASNDATQGAPGIDPLKAIDPIEVSPIAQANIAPEPIAVRPLNPIAQVQVAPLTPPDRRD